MTMRLGAQDDNDALLLLRRHMMKTSHERRRALESLRRAALVSALAATATAQAQSPSRMAPPAGPRWIVVSNERSHDLTLLDGRTWRVAATIPAGGRARGVRLAPDGRAPLGGRRGGLP